ncbi:hypothetical protein IEQ34_025249 [Dendrobium chrysotoxum]|uniref:magnesium chelatase n=1 Tax=Dendrobium chrysotoxum TaxID=161865 RepID=A0AAV7FQA9_DENCH|nr:hypothetical protein IEQ34_025249 [Dendrobium chrysotoxum]
MDSTFQELMFNNNENNDNSKTSNTNNSDNQSVSTHTDDEIRKIPLVDLPLGATEDRVCGTLDIEKALTQGIKAFEPGLLAKANRGILYVDEVNLLDDHLVDILLDAAASGWNTVEREGISLSHPAKFILIGSGNPEEGELRPQLLDRFGMFSEINTVREAELRLKTYYFLSISLKNITDLFIINVDGLRGDIVTNRAAKALAAFNGRDSVSVDDILTVVSLCIRHRLRKDPLESIEIDSKTKVKEIALQVFEEANV